MTRAPRRSAPSPGPGLAEAAPPAADAPGQGPLALLVCAFAALAVLSAALPWP